MMHAIADLGFEYCTPVQEQVLSLAKDGQNVAGRAQTGTGKTAAFLILIFSEFLKKRAEPSRPKGAPRALVLAPTRELVIQIIKDAEAVGRYCPFHCQAVYGGMDFEKQRAELENNRIDLIAATPGRLLDFKGRGVLNLRHVEVLVIDEADRMLDMGFIPDVRRIIRALPGKHDRRTMLFSATLTDDVKRLASQWMPDPVSVEVEPEQVAVDTVDQIVYVVSSREKFRLLYNLLQKPDATRVLVFANRRDRTLRLATNLRNHGVECEVLSGAVPQRKRLGILNGFREGRIRVVVATDVAGRGIHVESISHVVNYDFPYEPEDYVHRIGRTGRAGQVGTAVSLACEDESFIIPEIEKYIGEELPCSQPDEQLLVPLPRPLARKRHRPMADRAPDRGAGRRRPTGPRRGRPGGRRPPRASR